MGLDMYAYTINADLVENLPDTDVNVEHVAMEAAGFVYRSDEEADTSTKEESDQYYARFHQTFDTLKDSGIVDFDFEYWRKFNALHGWMADLYASKGGNDPTFNCNTVRLREADLDKLEEDARNLSLEPTEGFCFGSYEEFDSADRDAVLDFVYKARRAIAGGKAVFYNSWW